MHMWNVYTSAMIEYVVKCKMQMNVVVCLFLCGRMYVYE